MSEEFEWGVHLLRPVDAGEARWLGEQGLDRVAVHLPWRWWEAAPGTVDVRTTDWFLEPLRAAGVPLLGLLGPAMPHLLPDHAADVDAAGWLERFAASCATAVTAFPDIDCFRVEDTLNAAALERRLTRRRRGAAWKDPAFATRLLLAATTAVRRARPDARLQITAHVGVPGWRRHVRRWVDAGVDFDRLGLVLQPALVLPDPEMARRVGDAIEQARTLVDVPVEIARVGCPTGGRRFSPRIQREFLGIAAAEAKRAGGAGLTWWALRDQAHADPILGYWLPDQERRYGLLYYDGTPKPAADELRVLATGARFAPGGAP